MAESCASPFGPSLFAALMQGWGKFAAAATFVHGDPDAVASLLVERPKHGIVPATILQKMHPGSVIMPTSMR